MTTRPAHRSTTMIVAPSGPPMRLRTLKTSVAGVLRVVRTKESQPRSIPVTGGRARSARITAAKAAATASSAKPAARTATWRCGACAAGCASVGGLSLRWVATRRSCPARAGSCTRRMYDWRPAWYLRFAGCSGSSHPTRRTAVTAAKRVAAWDARTLDRLGSADSAVPHHVVPRRGRAADHGLLWFAVAGGLGATRKKWSRRAALRGVAGLTIASTAANVLAKQLVGRARPAGLAPALPRP